MIRVNLLATTTAGAPKRVWLPVEQRSAMMGLALLIMTAAGTGLWWWEVRGERIRVDNAISSNEREILRLKDVARLVDRASARRAELTERVGLIERLRLTQRDPVTLLETVSRSLPDGLWLTEIRQLAAAVQIDGRATSLTSITDFVERLQDSGTFERPVEIVTTTSDTVDQTDVVKFTIKAQTINREKAKPATGAASTATSASSSTPPAASGQGS